ncbi:MAG: hypothetical protein BWY75_02366 [bacterium ADurb.Bin425]|nr:MAG: hypothetical protein BWY75_02366 [bacterium ADurb.Bin425]
MPACLSQRVNNLLPDFGGEVPKFLMVELLELTGCEHRIEKCSCRLD